MERAMKLTDRSLGYKSGNDCKDAMNNWWNGLCSLRNKNTKNTKPELSGFSSNC